MSRLEKKDYPSILFDYEIPRESSHNTKGDISVHKKTSQSQNNNYINKLLLRERSIPTIRAENKRPDTDKKEPRSLRKALLFILLSLLSLLLLKIGKRGAHSYSHHREQILRERERERLECIKERERRRGQKSSLYLYSKSFPGKTQRRE